MNAYRLICATLIHNSGETEMRRPAGGRAAPQQGWLRLRREHRPMRCSDMKSKMFTVGCCNQLDSDDNKRRTVLRGLTLKGYNGWQYSVQAISASSDAS